MNDCPGDELSRMIAIDPQKICSTLREEETLIVIAMLDANFIKLLEIIVIDHYFSNMIYVTIFHV